MPPDRNTTALLNEQAIDELLQRTLGRLRRLAKAIKAGCSVETDELVDGAIMKLFFGKGTTQWDSSDHFFKFVAYVMRQVLIDHKRRFRPTQPIGSAEVASPVDPPDNQAGFDDLVVFLSRQMEKELAGDPQALLVLREHLFEGEGGEPLSLTVVAQRMRLEYHTVVRARNRGIKALEHIIRGQLDDRSP